MNQEAPRLSGQDRYLFENILGRRHGIGWDWYMWINLDTFGIFGCMSGMFGCLQVVHNLQCVTLVEANCSSAKHGTKPQSQDVPTSQAHLR